MLAILYVAYQFTFKGLLIHTWEPTWQSIRKAGTIILAISILFWALMAYPELAATRKGKLEESRQEILAKVPEPFRVALQEGKERDPSLPAEARDAVLALRAIDREEARAALQYSLAGRLGLVLERATQW